MIPVGDGLPMVQVIACRNHPDVFARRGQCPICAWRRAKIEEAALRLRAVDSDVERLHKLAEEVIP